MSTSHQWQLFPETRVKLALEHHRQKMLQGVAAAKLSAADERIVSFACEAAMLRRYLDFSAGRFPLDSPQQARVEQLLTALPDLPTSLEGPLRSRVLLPLSRSAELLHDHEQAFSYAARAVETDLNHWEALAHYGRLLLTNGRPEEALDCISRANSMAPLGCGLEQLTRQCTVAIEQSYAAL